MRTVLGIDPGLCITGYCIMQMQQCGPVLHDCGIIKLSSTQTIASRLNTIYQLLQAKILENGVCEIALETPFLGKNAQNFLKLGYVRGILYLLAAQHNLVIHELAPRQVKCAITGFGGADKEQVARVLMRLFPGLTKTHYDLTDAVGVALCGIWHK